MSPSPLTMHGRAGLWRALELHAQGSGASFDATAQRLLTQGLDTVTRWLEDASTDHVLTQVSRAMHSYAGEALVALSLPVNDALLETLVRLSTVQRVPRPALAGGLIALAANGSLPAVSRAAAEQARDLWLGLESMLLHEEAPTVVPNGHGHALLVVRSPDQPDHHPPHLAGVPIVSVSSPHPLLFSSSSSSQDLP